MIKYIIGQHTREIRRQVFYLYPLKAIAFVKPMCGFEHVDSPQVQVCDAFPSAVFDEDSQQLLRDRKLFAAEFFFDEHLPERSGSMTSIHQCDGADKLAFMYRAPEATARLDVMCFDVQQVALPFKGDRDIEFDLLDGQDEIDYPLTIVVCKRGDGDLCCSYAGHCVEFMSKTT